ncbi:MAG: hypothetical protein CMJ18_26315 [Phycisphaeraceae bacterium]|nr:hypothetical protein [Phycisphaeraceae bacterium]
MNAMAWLESRSSRMKIMKSVPFIAWIVWFATQGMVIAEEAPRVPLPRADRAEIEKYLGRGVIGKPLPAAPLEGAPQYFDLENGAEFKYRIMHGDLKGEQRVARLTRLSRPGVKVSKWRFADGVNQVMYGRITPQGNLESHSTETRDQGVISRYAPAQPVLMKGMKAGQVHKTKITVTVFDLADPDKQKHSGYLKLAYSYVGTYEVQVPAGRFEAVLLRWHYKGKVGPAKVEDRQYWLMARGTGPVAMIQQTDVSAFLVYQDHSKVAAALVERL